MSRDGEILYAHILRRKKETERAEEGGGDSRAMSL